jgi:hypothetical protein
MLYADNVLSAETSQRLDEHLDQCPVCRQVHADTQQLRSALGRIPTPDLKNVFRTQIKASVTRQLRSRKTRWLPVPVDIREWIVTRVMPLGVGVLASVVVGIGVLSLMLNSRAERSPLSSSETTLLASNRNPLVDVDSLTPSEYARTRLNVSGESPSVNPQGALVALTKSFVRGDMKDDEVVVVADVFGNGLARIAEVVEPSRDRRAVLDLEKALASDPAYAPFVAANLDNRAESVRVVLKFQSVNVHTNTRQNRR